MKTTNAVSDRLKPNIRESEDTMQPSTEKNYGWHYVRPFDLEQAGVKRPKSKCICGRMATVLSANHTDPQELFYGCRHCAHTFYRTNETGVRL